MDMVSTYTLILVIIIALIWTLSALKGDRF